MKNTLSILTCGIMFIGNGQLAIASDLNIPNQFQAGTAAVAAEVNDNFSATKNAVDDNHQRVAALEAQVDALTSSLADQSNAVQRLINQVTALENTETQVLNSYLSVDETSDPRGPLITFTGVNLRIVNGLAATETVNGLGNLIIGYDEETSSQLLLCSIGTNLSPSTCDDAGGIWASSHKQGSHNLVIGPMHNYSQAGSLVVGKANSVLHFYASVTAGTNNRASNQFSSVNGGDYNIATGELSSIAGGSHNIASGLNAAIAGGLLNMSTGLFTTIGGGRENEAAGETSTVSGGYKNSATGINSTVSGGYQNLAEGVVSNVSGGGNNSAIGGRSHVSGGEGNEANGLSSSVSGGNERTTSSQYDWAAGSLYENF